MHNITYALRAIVASATSKQKRKEGLEYLALSIYRERETKTTLRR